MLVFSLNEEQVRKWVFPSPNNRQKCSLTIDGKKTDDVVAFLKALKDDPKRVSAGDLRNIHYCLVLSDQSMDPVTGVRIYPFTADELFVKKWRKKLDALFVQIKQDIDQDKLAADNKPQVIINPTSGLINMNMNTNKLPEKAQLRLAVLAKHMQK